jgi:hypothetical protein
MPRIARIILSGFIGAVVCAGLSFLSFVMMAVSDNQKRGDGEMACLSWRFDKSG